MSKIKLLPCPFCGGEVKFGTKSHHWLVCEDCGVETEYTECEEELVRKWNTRKPMQEIVERLEEKYRIAQTEYSEAKYLLEEMDTKDRNYISQNYRKDMNEGLCFGFDDAIEIVKEVGGMNESTL